MKLAFLYVPAGDVGATAAFYREVMGFEEVWRDGQETIAIAAPDIGPRLMVSDIRHPAGPMYLVDDLTRWLEEHPGIEIVAQRESIPDGSVIGLADPAGNAFYVFDQNA